MLQYAASDGSSARLAVARAGDASEGALQLLLDRAAGLALETFANYCRENKVNGDLVKLIITSAETLFPHQRELFEEQFGAEVFNRYGCREVSNIAQECAAHRGLHVNLDRVFVEIVDEEGNPVDEGDHGLVVSTSLQNFGMPLIRYKTSDISAIRQHTCTCGRQMPLMESITTKAEDIIVSPDGRLISPSILTHPFKPMVNIEKSQIIQEDKNSIRIKIVRKPGYTERDTEILLQGLQPRVGHDMRILVEYVDDIERTPSGKYRWVISKVVKDIYDFNQ